MSLELRLKCKECEKNIMWNEKRMCDGCDAVHSSIDRVINNDNEKANDRCNVQCDKGMYAKESKKKK